MQNVRRYFTSLTILALLTISLVPTAALLQPLQAQPTGYVGSRNETSKEVLYSKALVLNTSLVRVLSINITDEVRAKVNELIAVNLSELPEDRLRDWVRNASHLLSNISSEVKEGKAFKVGIVLERYLNGLRNALENRARTLARHYQITVNVDEIVSNSSRARDVNQVIKTYKEFAKEVEEKNSWRFKEAIEELAQARTKALIKGNASILVGADKELEKAEAALEKTLERLKAVNASQKAVESVEEALNRVRGARDLLQEVADEVGKEKVTKPERVKEIVTGAVELMVSKVNQTLNELLEELETLKEEAVKRNLTKVVNNIDELITSVGDLRNRIKDISAENIYGILDEVVKIKILTKRIEEQIKDIIKDVVKEDNERVKELAEVKINNAEALLNTVKELRGKVNELNQCNEGSAKPSTPVCRVNVTKLLINIDEKISDAEKLIETAKQLYKEGNYVKALTNAVKALGILNAAKSQLEALLKLLTSTPKAQEVVPIPPKTP